MARHLGITVKELAVLCLDQIEKGTGDKHIIISNDDEGNGYHTLFYAFTDDAKNLECILKDEHDGTHTIDNCVCLG